MKVNPTKGYKTARENANYFGVPYVVFTDTSGNVRVERYDEILTCHREGTVFYPQEDEHAT